MEKGGWIITNDEDYDVNKDVANNEDDDDDDDDANDPNHQFSYWCDLPDLLLEDIFSYLTLRERYYASLVCRNWHSAFYLPKVWTNFIVYDRTLTRAKYNYYSGWQYVLDHLRTQNCFTRIGHLIKGLDFRPVHSFHNLYQFMTLITWCIQQGRKTNCSREIQDVGAKINSLTYVFPCNMASTDDPESIKLFGTGGQLLAALKHLLSEITQLKTLKLYDLMLERYEAKHLLDEVLESCCFVIKTLHLVNVTTVHCPILHVGLFLNLQVLVISPQNIDDDVLILLSDSKIRQLYLYQNRFTSNKICISPCSVKMWRNIKRDNPKLRVFLRVESNGVAEVLLQPEAPVQSITYSSPKTRITTDEFISIVDNYKNTLTIFGHELLPRFTSAKSFHNRIDSLLLLMMRQCPYLTTLIIREKISTATVLLLAKTGINLKYLYVRRNAVILRCDWPKNPNWSDEFYQWLKIASRSYETTEQEVSQILNCKWVMLPDRIFKDIKLNHGQQL